MIRKGFKRVVKKATALALSLAFVMGTMSGCTGGTGGSGKPITLTVYSQTANFSGEQTGWSGQVLLDEFNVILNIVPDADGVYDTRMEAGDLGDIVVWGSDDDDYGYPQAVEAGLLYDWNEDNLLEEYGPYIYEHMPYALEKNQNMNSDGLLHGFGHDVALNSEEHQAFFYTWDTRWDLYKELGYPAVKDLDDMVELFKDMKEICPTDDAGNPTYAVSLWPDWDGTMVMYVKATATAYYGYDELGVGLYDPETGDYHDALEENGPYLEMLKFYNNLYQNDLLDPDSMTATYDTMFEKVKKGGTFFSIFNYAGYLAYNTDEHVAEGKMMRSLTPADARPIVYGMSVLGGVRVWSIGAKTEYPELCMEVINYLATPEGRMTMEYGPQGVTWDYDEDGNTYFTELGLKTNADVLTPMEGDYTGTFKDGQFQVCNTTWNLDSENPDSNGETYNDEAWKSNLTEAKSDIEQDWRDYTGADTIEQYMEGTNYRVSPITAYVQSSRPGELKTTWAQVTDCITTYSWKAIYAKTDEEYDQIVAEMISKANEYGYDKCIEWSVNEANTRKGFEDALKTE